MGKHSNHIRSLMHLASHRNSLGVSLNLSLLFLAGLDEATQNKTELFSFQTAKKETSSFRFTLLTWLSHLSLHPPPPLLSCCSSSHQVELLQVVSEDGVFDGNKDEADVLSVCGAGEVRVQRLVFVRVLFLVHFQDEFLSRCGILLRSCKSRLRLVHCLRPNTASCDL